MAQDGGPEDDKPRSGKRRRRPRTLDLKAKEVKAEEQQQNESAAKPTARQARAGASAASDQAPSAAEPSRFPFAVPILTGVAGALVGAILVYLLLPQTDSSDPRIGQLRNELATLTERIESLAARPLPAPAPDQSGLAARIDKLTAAIGSAEQRLAAVEKRPEPKAPDLSVVDRRTAEIEATLQELRAGLADVRSAAEKAPQATSQSVEKLSSQLGRLESRISSLAAAQKAEPAGDALAREVVALNALVNALRTGKPFAQELAAARELLGERAAKLSALEPYAQQGLPRIETLSRQFEELAPAILRGPELNGNFFERLMTNAARLVEVRRVGEPQGASLNAIVARAETKLAQRDLDGAIREVESLPEDKRQIARDWLDAAKLRRDGEALVQSLAEDSLARAREAAKQ